MFPFSRQSSPCLEGSEEVKPGLLDETGKSEPRKGLLKWIEEIFFPKNRLLEENISVVRPPPRSGVLLHGCDTPEEHYARIRDLISIGQDKYGSDGLREVGFEYIFVPCDAHKPFSEERPVGEVMGSVDLSQMRISSPGPPNRTDSFDSAASEVSSRSSMDFGSEDLPLSDLDNHHCFRCKLQLSHLQSNTLIDEKNRHQFIADGDMYELLTRLAMEAAHEQMIEEGNLEWVTIEDDGEREPIKALVNRGHPLIRSTTSEEPKLRHRPTLMIATGRGKVRAGIFSRQHLLCTGMESSTALPIVREAVVRELNIVIPDPNAQGDRLGFETFSKTMKGIFHQLETPSTDVPLKARDLYILSHSASGGQLARYLLDKSDAYLPHLRAIAFTDSTHNIQWCKTHGNDELYEKLESPECAYFRCATVRTEDTREWHLDPPGKEIQTDSFWQRRFGKIKTYWAGTKEHSLTNWYAHQKIWEHFDRHMGDHRMGSRKSSRHSLSQLQES